MFKQHTDNIILIPQHISRIALFSVQLVLFVCYLAYIYEYTRLCILLFGLYVSSIFHWNKVKYEGIVKTIDILFANGVFIHVTIFDCNRFIYRNIWYVTAVISIVGFITNEYLFYHQVLKYKNKRVIFTGKYWYFSLDYTNPNTMNRELAYYRSTFTHMFFVHILPTTVCAYLGVSSYINK
jgi:hypothetical protein